MGTHCRVSTFVVDRHPTYLSSALSLFGEQLVRVIVMLANGGWPDGGCGFSRSRLVFTRGYMLAGSAAESWSRWTLTSSFGTGSSQRGDRPSRPDVTDTSQGTHIDWWIDNFCCLIRSGSFHGVCVSGFRVSSFLFRLDNFLLSDECNVWLFYFGSPDHIFCRQSSC